MAGLGRITTIPPGGKLIWRFTRSAARFFECFVGYTAGNEVWNLRSDGSTDHKSFSLLARYNVAAKSAKVQLDSGSASATAEIDLIVVDGVTTRSVVLDKDKLSLPLTEIAGTLHATGAATLDSTLNVTGAITGNLTGNVTGNVSGAVTGNADTATKLATARAINGVNFDGSAAITVPAAAGTLSGATLAAGVTASSLTSLGTLTALAISGILSLTAAVSKIVPGATSLSLRNAADSADNLLITDAGVASHRSTLNALAGINVGTATAAATGQVKASASVLATQPMAHVYNSANQTISDATETTLNFNSERYDTDTIHDIVTNNSRLTCKTAGKYRVTANVRFLSNATGLRYAYIRWNGVDVYGMDVRTAVNGLATLLTCVETIPLAVNDYLELRVYQNRGGTLDVEALDSTNIHSTSFKMEYLGD